MRVLLDTSVLTSAILEAHPEHNSCLPWLQRAQDREIELLVAAHSLAELFAVLTRAPLQPRISPKVARKLIQVSVEDAAEIVTLSSEDYFGVLTDLATMELSGGIVYDALIAKAATKAGADRLLTLNLKHFQRLWPEAAALVFRP